MLSIKERGILIYIIGHCERIETKINGISKEEFLSNIDLKEIVCFNIFQIGELAKGLSEDFIKNYSGVPWKEIKGMRDRIGHGYGTIKIERVWETAISDIFQLKKYCKYLLENN